MWRGPSTKRMLWFVTHAELGVTEDLTAMGIYLPDLKSQGSMQSKTFTSSLSPLETAFPPTHFTPLARNGPSKFQDGSEFSGQLFTKEVALKSVSLRVHSQREGSAHTMP